MPRHSRTALEHIADNFASDQAELKKLQIHSAIRSIKPVPFKKQYSKYPWFITIPLLLVCGYMYTLYVQDRGHRNLMSQANLGIHEIGHLVFGIFGNQLLGVMGGTLMQLLVPILFMIGFFYRKEYFVTALGFARLSSNFFYMAMYAYDATRLQLPMLSMGASSADQLIHDRNYMFDTRGVIQFTDQIAYSFATLGTICMVLCFGYAGWLIYQREMINLQDEN